MICNIIILLLSSIIIYLLYYIYNVYQNTSMLKFYSSLFDYDNKVNTDIDRYYSKYSNKSELPSFSSIYKS